MLPDLLLLSDPSTSAKALRYLPWAADTRQSAHWNLTFSAVQTKFWPPSSSTISWLGLLSPVCSYTPCPALSHHRTFAQAALSAHNTTPLPQPLGTEALTLLPDLALCLLQKALPMLPMFSSNNLRQCVYPPCFSVSSHAKMCSRSSTYFVLMQ